MYSINKLSFINKPSRLFYTDFSHNFCSSPNSFPSTALDLLKFPSNNFFNSSNLSFTHRFTRNFSSSVSKASVSPSLTNQKSSNLYAPYVYEEVRAPAGGGPVYWRVRKFIMNFKRRANLRARERRWNWDVVRAAFAGVPKLSYDPKINQWVTLMDNEEWGGVGGRFWIEFSNKILFNLLFAYVFYYCWYRIVFNNKHNVFARWKNREGDEEDE